MGIGLGIHWIVYSWIIQHPVGLIHAILRTGLVVTAWCAFPGRRLLAVPAVIVIVYLISLAVMARRPIPGAGVDRLRWERRPGRDPGSGPPMSQP